MKESGKEGRLSGKTLGCSAGLRKFSMANGGSSSQSCPSEELSLTQEHPVGNVLMPMIIAWEYPVGNVSSSLISRWISELENSVSGIPAVENMGSAFLWLLNRL